MTIPLKDGLLTTESDNLYITDKAKHNKYSLLFFVLVNIFLCLSMIIRELKSNDNEILIIYSVLLFISLLLLIKWFKEFRCTTHKIPVAGIQKVKLNSIWLDDSYAVLIKTISCTRRIKIESDNLQQFIDYLQQTGIPCVH